jgi:hypothetical protein
MLSTKLATKREGKSTTSVIDLRSDWVEEPDEVEIEKSHASFGLFLNLFSGDKKNASDVVPLDSSLPTRASLRRQNEVELVAQNEVLKADRKVNEGRFEEKLKNKKLKKKRLISNKIPGMSFMYNNENTQVVPAQGPNDGVVETDLDE